jgi:hypothetical protein
LVGCAWLVIAQASNPSEVSNNVWIALYCMYATDCGRIISSP